MGVFTDITQILCLEPELLVPSKISSFLSLFRSAIWPRPDGSVPDAHATRGRSRRGRVLSRGRRSHEPDARPARIATFGAAVPDTETPQPREELASVDRQWARWIGRDAPQRRRQQTAITDLRFGTMHRFAGAQNRRDIGLRRSGQPVARHASRGVVRGAPPSAASRSASSSSMNSPRSRASSPAWSFLRIVPVAVRKAEQIKNMALDAFKTVSYCPI
jgi:hypothetical protein